MITLPICCGHPNSSTLTQMILKYVQVYDMTSWTQAMYSSTTDSVSIWNKFHTNV